MEISQFVPVNVKIEESTIDEERVLRVRKPLENLVADTDTYARVKNVEFHNGSIEVDMYSKLQEGAPDYSRGFIGIVFRINAENNEFESFYVRPTNGRHPDPIRRSHGSQYFSYPGYTFDYFRKHGITKYEAPVDIDLYEWIHLKAEIQNEHAAFYVNGQLILEVEDLKHGSEAKGGVGLYTDIGTDGYFKNLHIQSID